MRYRIFYYNGYEKTLIKFNESLNLDIINSTLLIKQQSVNL